MAYVIVRRNTDRRPPGEWYDFWVFPDEGVRGSWPRTSDGQRPLGQLQAEHCRGLLDDLDPHGMGERRVEHRPDGP